MRTILPLNRFVAFIKPYLDLVAASVAAYLVAKVNVLGIKGLDQNNLATQLSAGLVFLATKGGAALGNWQFLKGHHIELQAVWADSLPASDPEGPGDDDALPAIATKAGKVPADKGDAGAPA